METPKRLLLLSRTKYMVTIALSRKIRMHRSCYERMGTRLRRLKTKMRGTKKLSDGKPLCGRNRLTEAEIDRLQAYYGGSAIRRNLSSVKNMQQAIWAIFFYTNYQPMKNLSMDFVPLIQIRGANLKRKAELLGRLIITRIVYLWMLCGGHATCF
ncbi:uncharacterized protein TNCV_3207911 [Trichonephila clavipes]|nr:uncharacterized protein TNCV_3207911 [Trichonephila clavipes]